MSTTEVPINLHGGWAQTGPESWVRVDHLVTIAIDSSLGDSRVMATLDVGGEVLLGVYADSAGAVSAVERVLGFSRRSFSA
jgi:hypothetical protein